MVLHIVPRSFNTSTLTLSQYTYRVHIFNPQVSFFIGNYSYFNESTQKDLYEIIMTYKRVSEVKLFTPL